MSSTISRLVIKSDQVFRKIPSPGEAVSVIGKSGLFVVMNIDRQAQVAQLMEKSGRHRLTTVPFSSIKSFNRNLAHAIRRFIDSREEPREGG